MNAFYGREHAEVPEFIVDHNLFRSRCYIDGEWVAAQGGGSHIDIQPVYRETHRQRPKVGGMRTPGAPSRPPTPHFRPGAPKPPRSGRQPFADGMISS